jgi:CheY-like chemotaxis protein/anti-sigma regulatory factor (Ser/Thr protein kinase)
VNVKQLIGDCLNLVKPVAQRHGIRIPTDAAASCDCHVLADRVRAKQVLLNLLSNAIKFNREGGTVEVACTEEGEYLHISVIDTGRGLSAEQQQRLFQNFERLGVDEQAIEGTGIGLALSKRLVTMMQGEIGVDSQVGVGSTFWVRLKRVEPGAVPSTESTPMVESQSRGAVAARARTVLYIEDNPVNVRLVEHVLQMQPGTRLVTASLPEAGLAMARTERPDLILLDIQLPGMDGYEVLRRLRHADTTRAIPVIAISASAMSGDVQRGLAAGLADYITKPIDVLELLAAMERALSG